MENKMINSGKMAFALVCGILGCILMGSGDWLMIYGDTAYEGSTYWLTEGVALIPAWRNALSMAVSFPAVIFYGIALFAIANFLKNEKQRKIYHYLTAFSLTPWLCLHLFYVMILYVFAWMNCNGYKAAALAVSEAMLGQFSWIVIVSEVLMLPPFLYWFYLLISGKSMFPEWMAFSNPLIYYVVLRLIRDVMPDSAFRIAFTNGLMSESMFIWFAVMIVWSVWGLSGIKDGKCDKG